MAATAAAPLVVLVLTAPAQPSSRPSPTPSGPTPTPSATSGPPSGELQVTKSDPSGVPLANATFKVTSASDPSFSVQLTTSDPNGSVTLANLTPGMYCLEEIAVPQGYLLQPTYAPNRCVLVTSDPNGHDNPTKVSVVDPPASTPSPNPTATPTPTPAPTPAPTGKLQVVKTDAAGQAVAAPGFTFDIRAGSPSGTVVATITTDTSGTAIAAALSPTTHCVEETAAADGYQLAPTYTPRACVMVTADPTNGASPARVTVADPPSGDAAAASTARPPLSPVHRAVTGLRSSTATISPAALVGFGAALLVIGLLMIAVGISRRHPGVPAR